MNPEPAAILCTDDGGKGLHDVTSFKRRDLGERLADLHLGPIGFELGSMQYRPLANPPQRTLRSDAASPQLALEVERRVVTLMLSMEMRRLMFLVEHSDHNPKEYGDDRHDTALYRRRRVERPRGQI